LFQIEAPVAVTPLILQPQSKCQVTEKETWYHSVIICAQKHLGKFARHVTL
jgi:hypothetical protein